MSDTTLFGKTIRGTDKAMLLYVGNAVALAVGGAMMALDQTEWDSWWWMKKIGWTLILLGNVFNTMKAFYSNSTPNS
jgi:hypothetical protein